MEQPIPPPIVPVRRRSRIMTIVQIVVIILAVAFGLNVLYCAWIMFVPHRRTVTNVSALQRVYHRAGPQIALTFTNSLIQRFPFEGKVDWELGFFKAPRVVLSGKVDTNALRQFVSDHPSILFAWSGVDKNGQNWFAAENWPSTEENARIIWDSVSFQVDPVGGGYAAVIQGEVKFPSCMGWVSSWSPDWIPPDKK